MSIVFKCECGRVYEVADVSAGRTAYCFRCKRPMIVPAKTRPEPPRAVPATGVQAAPPGSSALRGGDAGREAGSKGGPGAEDSRSEPPGEVPSIKRGFNRIDLALIAWCLLLAAALFWYFLGYRLFDGPRLYPAAVMFLTGVSMLVKNISRDMQD
jgi:hypothetical protein